MLFIVLGLAVLDGHRSEGAHQSGPLSDAAGKNSVFGPGFIPADHMESIAAGLAFFQAHFEKFHGGFDAFADKFQFSAGGDHTGVVHHSEDKIHIVLHFQQDALKQACCHQNHPLSNFNKLRESTMSILMYFSMNFNNYLQNIL